MKAQSELAGDRERRAEMTRPRFIGVTNWMPMDGMTSCADTLVSCLLDVAGTRPAFEAVKPTVENIRNDKVCINSEVKCRPVGQQ